MRFATPAGLATKSLSAVSKIFEALLFWIIKLLDRRSSPHHFSCPPQLTNYFLVTGIFHWLMGSASWRSKAVKLILIFIRVLSLLFSKSQCSTSSRIWKVKSTTPPSQSSWCKVNCLVFLPGVRIVCGLSRQYCLAFWLATHAIPQDVCMTSIFGSSWMCEQCGREICLECYQSLTSEVRNSMVKYCVHNQEHSQATFLPISRFQKSELLNALEDMKSITRPDDLLW